MKCSDEVILQAQSRWISQVKPEGECGSKGRAFRRPGDKEPLGFELEGVNYEVHYEDKNNIRILVFNARGDAKVYAKQVWVLPCG